MPDGFCTQKTRTATLQKPARKINRGFPYFGVGKTPTPSLVCCQRHTTHDTHRSGPRQRAEDMRQDSDGLPSTFGFPIAELNSNMGAMKTDMLLTIICGLLTLCMPYARATSAIGVGARHHVQHTAYEDYPYADGDLSYTIAYEYHDAAGYWQLMVGFTPDVGERTAVEGDSTTVEGEGTTEEEAGAVVESIITPQINLMIEDRIWLAGVGILSDYIETSEDTEWSDIYWQVILGILVPIGNLELEILAYYPFEDWGTIGDFDADDIEFGASIKFLF